jgi:uncharacterized protein YbjT (DUF2867 family)
MPQNLVLVTGAAGGNQGQTGRHVSELLLAQGVPVRAFVHRIDERSERLRALGADVFEGDLLDIASVRTALRDVDRVYFAYPVQDGLLDATGIMAVNARDAGVSRLVNLVMLRSSLDAPTPRMQQNYLSERIFDWAGVGALHLRATVFFENLRALIRMSFAADGAIRIPLGSDRTVVPLISAQDVARVATGLLTATAAPDQTTYPLIGDILTVNDIIVSIARVFGKEVRYVDISDDEWRAMALAHGFNDHSVRHLSALWESLRVAGGETQRFSVADPALFGGVIPKNFEQFVRDEVAVLATPLAHR